MAAALGAGLATGVLAGLATRWLAPVDGPAGILLLNRIPLDQVLPVLRAVFDAAGVVTVGLTLIPLLLLGARARDSAPVLALAQRGTVVIAAVWAAAAALLLWAQVAAAANISPLEVSVQLVGAYVDVAVGGRALLVAGACGLAVAVTGVLSARRAVRIPTGLPPVVMILGLVALPITGHAATARAHEVAVLAVALHVAAAAAWVGGLGALTWLAVSHRELLVASLPRYSRLAGACLVAVAVTGVVGAVLRLPSTDALLTTPYGWIMMGKAAGLVALGALGAHARSRLLPAVTARRPVPLTGWLATELLLMGAVLGLAATLAHAVPPT